VRYETRIERIGEDMGPIDWDYNFRQHFDRYCCSAERQDEYCAQSIALLRRVVEMESTGRPAEVNENGFWKPLYKVCMYDGWPYWKPTPYVLVGGVLGSEWHPFYSLQDVRWKEGR
jgi:hypothetical protein